MDCSSAGPGYPLCLSQLSQSPWTSCTTEITDRFSLCCSWGGQGMNCHPLLAFTNSRDSSRNEVRRRSSTRRLFEIITRFLSWQADELMLQIRGGKRLQASSCGLGTFTKSVRQG